LTRKGEKMKSRRSKSLKVEGRECVELRAGHSRRRSNDEERAKKS
jgi:hypothetical protein